MSSKILSNFYRCTVESILTSSIRVWYGNCTAQDRKALQRVVKTAQHISGAAFHSLQDIYSTRVTRRAHNIIKDSTHPQHRLFTLLPSGRRYQSLRSRTTRMTNSFYPQAIRLSLRQTSLFPFSGDKLDLLFCTIWPAKEKSLSHGTVVAGVPKYLRAMWAMVKVHRGHSAAVTAADRCHSNQ
ncbi:hypothetical protein N1851_018288 [Merluccius polli]|uniref:Uncharacterized protein n=1 Tax=Merluccius polli TaxID=89951 RepID=A0AA47MNC1_MERPO|nr:hypothetical protein N1851_018288 [Merluccius polli]